MENKYSLEVWEDYYKNEKKIHVQPKGGFFQSYDLFLCDSIFRKYLPRNKGEKKEMKMVEIGFGDGKLLKKIADEFNYEPWGIEYAAEGIKQAKDRGINTIQADAFDEAMLQKYEGFFDVVFSYGFIEHIIPPQKAIQMHMRLLKKGGYLVIQIPRLKQFNWLRTKLFRPDLLPLHNLPLMEEEVLHTLMQGEPVRELFCKNYGTLKLRVPMAKKDGWWYALKVICSLEYILNPLLRFVFGQRGFETKLLSPAVMFIGIKKDES